MEDTKLLDQEMAKVSGLVVKLRNSIRDSDEERDIFLELDSILKTMIAPAMRSDIRMMTTPIIDGLSINDFLLSDNKYEVVYIEDIAAWVIDGDHYRISDEKFQKILYYMIDNNIRSYRMDW